MSKQIDFAKQRRVQGRSLKGVVAEFSAVLKEAAKQQGIDLQLRLDESLARKSEKRRILVERLQESVVPLFVIGRGGRPRRIGSCVLVRLDSGYFAFTAAHVMREAGSAALFAPSEGKGGKLLPLPPFTPHLNYSGRSDDLDIAVLVLPALQLGAFRQRVFLSDTEIDQENRSDDRGFDSFYLVLGYSASPHTGADFSRRTSNSSTIFSLCHAPG